MCVCRYAYVSALHVSIYAYYYWACPEKARIEYGKGASLLRKNKQFPDSRVRLSILNLEVMGHSTLAGSRSVILTVTGSNSGVWWKRSFDISLDYATCDWFLLPYASRG
jgi:hypothetical protein